MLKGWLKFPSAIETAYHTKRHPNLEGHCLLTRPAHPKKAHYIGFAFSIEKTPLQDPGIATGPFNPS